MVAAALACDPAWAKLEDVEKHQQDARQNFIQRFTEFTKDKNFVGRPLTPDGQRSSGGKKTKFNADDGAPWQSDLTYHDFSYDTNDDAFAKFQKANPGAAAANQPKNRDLYAGISGHGSVSSGGGSSILERTAYGLHDKFAKAESDEEKKKKNAEQGIRYEGIFKIDTQEVKVGAAPGASPSASPDPQDVKKVERWEVRQEARPDIEKVGKDSFQTLEETAKTSPETMGTLAFYYAAANEALKSLWKSTLSNLTQRRAKEGIRGGDVQLSESAADCGKWSQSAIAKIDTTDPAARQRRVEEINKQRGQCEQMVAQSYKAINPRFERDPNNPNADPKLVQKGPEDEDGRERDMRVQLSLIDKVGTRAKDVQSNWKYSEQDEKSQVTTAFDQNGQAAGQEGLRMDEQVERYNQNLREAADAVAEVKTRFPDLGTTKDQVLGYQIQPKTKSAMEITQFPQQSVDENINVPVLGEQVKDAQNYNELIQTQGQ